MEDALHHVVTIVLEVAQMDVRKAAREVAQVDALVIVRVVAQEDVLVIVRVVAREDVLRHVALVAREPRHLVGVLVVAHRVLVVVQVGALVAVRGLAQADVPVVAREGVQAVVVLHVLVVVGLAVLRLVLVPVQQPVHKIALLVVLLVVHLVPEGVLLDAPHAQADVLVTVQQYVIIRVVIHAVLHAQEDAKLLVIPDVMAGVKC